MRGTVAKRIRRQVYGDQSTRQKRRYAVETVEKIMKLTVGTPKEGKKAIVKKGIIKNIGLRQQYQDAKRDYYAERKRHVE